MPRRNKRLNNTLVNNADDMLALASPTHEFMIGCMCPYGPGGRDCVCCGDAPGRARAAAKRANKRRKRQEFKNALKGSSYRSYREYLDYEYED